MLVALPYIRAMALEEISTSIITVVDSLSHMNHNSTHQLVNFYKEYQLYLATFFSPKGLGGTATEGFFRPANFTSKIIQYH
jgi:hypothetical protein